MNMKPDIIRYKHIRNIEQRGDILAVMGKKRFGDKFKGFLKETTFIFSEGFISIKIEPIEGSPTKEFRNSIERAGLVGKKFDFDKQTSNTEVEK